MRYFNVVVIAAWLAMFALSLRPINGTNPQDWNVLDNLTVSFNEEAIDICQSCAYPNEPFTDYNAQTKQYEAVEPQNLPIEDNRMTHAVLVNTFSFFVFLMAVINLAYYFGTGTIGRGAKWTLGKATTGGDVLWTATKNFTRRKPKEVVEPPQVEMVATES
jgi:hypothetical protein